MPPPAPSARHGNVHKHTQSNFATSFNGNLSQWDVSNVTDMNYMLKDATSFNGDLSHWDVRQVTDMDECFSGATSFNQQLGGSWAQSTADKHAMFYDSPGSIEGKTNDAFGTPV